MGSIPKVLPPSIRPVVAAMIRNTPHVLWRIFGIKWRDDTINMANFQCRHPTHETLQYPRVCCNRYQISRHIKTQNISRLTSTIHHNISCLIKGGNHVPFRPEKYLLHCFSNAKKHTILSAPKRRFQETNHDTLGCPVYDTATTHQGSTENDVNTLRYFYQKRNMFFPA